MKKIGLIWLNAAGCTGNKSFDEAFSLMTMRYIVVVLDVDVDTCATAIPSVFRTEHP
jgi:hypothetical protein